MAERNDISGLLAFIGREGDRRERLQDVVAEQVNLRVVTTENMMGKLRDMFADASISAARKWEFTPPARGDDVDAEYWSVRVPVDFNS